MTTLRLAAVAHGGTIACAARNVATPTALATPVQVPSAASSRRPGTGSRVVVAVMVVAVMVAAMVCSFGCGQVDVLRVRRWLLDGVSAAAPRRRSATLDRRSGRPAAGGRRR